MNFMKKMIVSTLVAFAMLASSAAFAGKDDAKVAQALNDTIAKLQEAITLVESKGDAEAIKQALTDAKQIQKEYRYEQTERKRQYAAEHIKNATNANKAGDSATTLTELKAALAGFQEMKPIYEAAH